MLKVFEYGKIDKSLKNEILRHIFTIIKDEALYVEIYLFDKLDDMTTFLYMEYRELNIQVTDIYFAMHDAYRGWPRIYVCIELLRKLPRDVWIGGIMHEAAHAILHGSPIYYYFSLPDNLLNALNRQVINNDTALKLLYYASVAVKDYEVSRYLVEHGYGDIQYPFIIYNLRLSRDELNIWRELQDHISRIGYIMKIFKVLAAALPLKEVDKYRDIIEDSIHRIIMELDMGYEDIMFNLLEVFKSFKGDTRDNIYIFTDTLASVLL